MTPYCNEIDPYAAAGLGTLMPHATIDTRSITEIEANDLDEYTQCHFFAGIGGWPLAIQLAGWPDNAPVWTGSCPCQPFSIAGKRLGEKDRRHLWPEFRRLITKCRPPTIFGEQVASPAGREWLAGVRTDLEALGYEVGAADLCAASAGVPHIRQRLFWGAHSQDANRWWMHHANKHQSSTQARGCGVANRLGVANSARSQPRDEAAETDGYGSAAVAAGPWSDYHLVQCRDGKTRRIPNAESGILPLAHGIPRRMGPLIARMGELGIDPSIAKRIICLARANRIGRLRGYGNAIVSQVAAEFVAAFMEVME